MARQRLSLSHGSVSTSIGVMAVLVCLGRGTAAAQTSLAGPPASEHPTDTGEEARPGALTWNPAWPRVRPVEYNATAFFGLAALFTLFLKPSSTQWNQSNGFDDALRTELRLSSQSARDAARIGSDVLLYTHLAYPIVVDGIAVAWWARGAPDVAWQTSVIDLQSFVLTAFVSGLVSNVASRERPYGKSCGGADADPADCGDRRYRSFFSGHTSTAFTSAGLVCVHHMKLPLYGGGAADALACGTAVLAASATGTLRVLADQHYATDVLVGAAVGTLSGFVTPYVLHYRARASVPAPRRGAAPSFAVVPVAPLGASLVGTF